MLQINRVIAFTVFLFPFTLLGQGVSCGTAEIVGDGVYEINAITSGTGASQPDATHSAWYLFRPDQNGQLTVGSCAGGTDTRLYIHEGDCGSLQALASNDDACDIDLDPDNRNDFAARVENLNIEAGKLYYIEWDDHWSSAGFSWSLSFLPDNQARPYQLTTDVQFEGEVEQVQLLYQLNDGPLKTTEAGQMSSTVWQASILAEPQDTLYYRFAIGSPDSVRTEEVPDLCGVRGADSILYRQYIVPFEQKEAPLNCFNRCGNCIEVDNCEGEQALYCTSFDQLLANTSLISQDTNWVSRSTSGEALITTETAYSGLNALLIGDGQNAGLQLPDLKDNIFSIRWRMKVNSGNVAGFRFTKDSSLTTTPLLEIELGENQGEGTVLSSGVKFKYTEDAWLDVNFILDASGQRIRFFLDDRLIDAFSFTGDPAYLFFFSEHSRARFFIDDVKVEALGQTCPSDAILCDGIEWYAKGGAISFQNYWWGASGGSTGIQTGAIVSDTYAFDGEKSLLISGETSTNALLLLGEENKGRYALEWKQYIPAGQSADVALLSASDPLARPELTFDFGFSNPDEGKATIGGADYGFTYSSNSWTAIRLEIDLNLDQIDVFINGTILLKSLPFEAEQLSFLFFRSPRITDVYYVDALVMQALPVKTVQVRFQVDLELLEDENAVAYLAGSFSNWEVEPMNLLTGRTFFLDKELPAADSISYTFYSSPNASEQSAELSDCTVADTENSRRRSLIIGLQPIELPLHCFGYCVPCASVITDVKTPRVKTVHLYPNPASSVLHLELTADATFAEARIQMSDTRGRLVFDRTRSFAGGKAVLDLSSVRLPPGMYYISIIKGDDLFLGKIVLE